MAKTVLVVTASCMQCDWTATENADKAAEKHTKTTMHPTITSGRPERKP